MFSWFGTTHLRTASMAPRDRITTKSRARNEQYFLQRWRCVQNKTQQPDDEFCFGVSRGQNDDLYMDENTEKKLAKEILKRRTHCLLTFTTPRCAIRGIKRYCVDGRTTLWRHMIKKRHGRACRNRTIFYKYNSGDMFWINLNNSRIIWRGRRIWFRWKMPKQG